MIKLQCGVWSGRLCGGGDENSVDIVETGTVVILSYEIIFADETIPLVNYLNDQGTETPEKLSNLFSYYILKGWN